MKLLVVGALICAVLLSGCVGSDEEKSVLSIGFDGVAAGALAPRIEDMRRAAELAIENTGADTPGHLLELVDPAHEDAERLVAVVEAPQPAPRRSGNTGELVVNLSVPVKAQSQDTIWLLPAWALESQALDDYAASGLPSSRVLTADSPSRAGTPKGTYITPALSAVNYPPAGRRFFKQFADEYGHAPDRYAIYAYEAVGLIVDAIQRLEEDDLPVTAAAVRDSAFAIQDRFSPVGHYDVLPNGRTTRFLFQARGDPAPRGDAALIEVGR